MKLLDLFWVKHCFLYIFIVLLHFLVLCGLYLFFLLMVFLLAHVALVIGRQRFLILVGWNIFGGQGIYIYIYIYTIIRLITRVYNCRIFLI